MNFLHATWVMYRFECIRTASVTRQLTWAALASFPIFVCLIVKRAEQFAPPGGGPQPDGWGIIMMTLLPGVFCVLGLVRSVTPILQSELEGKTWTYLSVRPGSRIAVIVGKYLAGITWTIPFGLVSLAICVVISGLDQWFRTLLVMSSLIVLSAVTYGAVFALFGVINPRRASVIAIVYAIFSEIVLSGLPSIAQRFTVWFHLRQMLQKGMDYQRTPPGFIVSTDLTAAHHVGALMAVTVLCLAFSIAILRQRELIANPEE